MEKLVVISSNNHEIESRGSLELFLARRAQFIYNSNILDITNSEAYSRGLQSAAIGEIIKLFGTDF